MRRFDEKLLLCSKVVAMATLKNMKNTAHHHQRLTRASKIHKTIRAALRGEHSFARCVSDQTGEKIINYEEKGKHFQKIEVGLVYVFFVRTFLITFCVMSF